MFDPKSRYYRIETTTYTSPDGRRTAYKRRRFLPRLEDVHVLVEAFVVEGDRLDLIAARTLGDPEQFWRICDANDPLNPFDLTVEPGRIVQVPIPRD
jgi:hypothetical protein